ncbi:MAG: class I SAM-dependent methyltransferase [Crocinitomicaceae bacterium]|nr:class I SAM-dependent methyltransferase [Crocinitomicaceae bacterium]
MSADRLYTAGWDDYELIDAGGGKKLERWGSIITIRPEVQAYFKSGKTFDQWNKMAHWEFISSGGQSGKWKCLKQGTPKEWQINYQDLTFNLKLTKFKHVGLFPEQRVNWDFLAKRLKSTDKFLNLFAYTGAASVVAKNNCETVLHIDSVKQLITWAKANMDSSNLEGIKWVHEDALKFAAREVKRKNHYHGIMMDPPAWGIGAKKEKWKLEDKLDELIVQASKIIGRKGFLILNTYSPKIDLRKLEVGGKMNFEKGRTEVRELWMKTSTGKDLYYGNLLRIHPQN